MRNPRKTPRRAALLGAALLALALAPAARAELIPSNATVTDNGGGVFTFSYDLKVLGTSQVQTGDFGVIYDVKGFVPGSITAPAGWSASWSNVGPAPTQTAPNDDPALPNVKWTYTGSSTISPGSTTVLISGFSYQSTFGLIGQADFASQTHLDPDPTHPSGRKVSNVTQVDVPAPDNNPGGGTPGEAPEPASLVLLGLGAPLAGLAAALRRLRAGQAA